MVCTLSGGTSHPGLRRIFRLLLEYYFDILIIHGLTGAFFVASFDFLSMFLVYFFIAGPEPIDNVAGWDGKIQEYDQERTQGHPQGAPFSESTRVRAQ